MIAFTSKLDEAPPLGCRSRARRILVVGEAVSLAHIGRPLEVARWARDAGYDVQVACGEAYAALVRSEGFAPHALLTVDAQTFYARLNAGKFFYTAGELEAYVHAERKLIDAVQPDLIVGDFRLTLGISAALAGHSAPLVSLNNAHWSPSAACAFPAPDSGFFRLLPAALRDGIFSLLRPLAFRTFAQPLNAVHRRFGLEPQNDFRHYYTAGDYCAYLDLPELSPVEALPSGHFYLGPVAWKPRGLTSPPLETLGTNRPVAYVSMGSSGDTRVLPNVLKALLNSNFSIALSGVSAAQLASLFASLPLLKTRCVAETLFNPRDILKRAAVTVCHGGSGTVYQSLAAGVPLLCLPGNPDQGLVAASALAQGSALVVEPRHASPARLTAALNALVNNPTHRDSALTLARTISRHDTRKCWLDFLARTVPQQAAPVPAYQQRQSEVA